MFRQNNLCQTIDKLAINLSLIYVILPIVLFFIGWLRPVLVGGGIVLFEVAFVAISRSFPKTNAAIVDFKDKDNRNFWFITLGLVAFWVYLSGIGGFVFQNGDHWVRNPIFRDLSTYSYPVIYDLSKESDLVQKICGSDKVAFSYYFCWWLPVSCLSKIFSLSEVTRNILLYLWALLGILLIVYLICRKIGKCTYTIPLILILFSGLDFVPYLLKNNFFANLPWTNHIEWWAGFPYFQYSSNTTQIFWVFNQSIPIWLLVAIFLQSPGSKYNAAILSMAFAYSPWATFGVVPYAVADFIRGKGKFTGKLNLVNIAIPVLLLIVFGSFYLASSGSNGEKGIIFSFHPGEERRIFCNYLLFIFFEFGIYLFAMGAEAKKYAFYWITAGELLIFPLLVVRDFNFEMRGSCAALFLLMCYTIRFINDNKDNSRLKLRNRVLIVALCIGVMTPLAEIDRTLQVTTTSDNVLQEQIGSFGNMQTDNAGYIGTAKNQFFVYNYNDTAFFKYLAHKRSIEP